MNEELFIKTYFEESVINLQDNFLNDNLYGERYNSRFSDDNMTANLYIANSKINKKTIDWNFADNVLKTAKKWKINTVYQLDEKLINFDQNKYIKVDDIENIKLKSILNNISNSEELMNKFFSTELLVRIENSLFLYIVREKILLKINEVTEEYEKCPILYLLSVPWRYMIIFGEIGLRKAYIEVGEIKEYLEQNVLQGYKYKVSDIIFSEEEKILGFTSVEKQVVFKMKVLDGESR